MSWVCLDDQLAGGARSMYPLTGSAETGGRRPVAAVLRHPCWHLHHPWPAAAALHESVLPAHYQAQQSSAHPGF